MSGTAYLAFSSPTVAASNDPYRTSVLLHAEANGVDGATTTVDSSPSPKTITSHGTPPGQLSTTQAWLGRSSMKFPDFYQSNFTLPGTGFGFGTGDFTLELAFFPTGTVFQSETLLQFGSVYAGQYLNITYVYDPSTPQYGGFITINYINGGTNYNIGGSNNNINLINLNVWNYVSVTRVSGEIKVHVNGIDQYVSGGITLTDSITAPSIIAIGNSDDPVNVPAGFTGYIDHVKITGGVGRYVGDYVPETSVPISTARMHLGEYWAPDSFVIDATGSEIVGIATVDVLAPIGVTVFGSARESYGDNAFTYTLTGITLYGNSGGNAAAAVPKPQLSVSGSFSISGSANLSIPSLLIRASGSVPSIGRANISLSASTLIGYSGAILSVSIGATTLSASGVSGAKCFLEIELPLFDITASGTLQGRGTADLVLPALRMVPGGAAWIIAPMAQLTAIGTAVVAVTYEAYALNLNHMQDGPDELTRYTNYPFDRIVRYKNSYFGMNSTGLYLLEGTTDFAEPTPTSVAWSFKTTLTDFDSAQLKTVNWAYFGGRLGPTASISIHYGDLGQSNYTYACPRGSSAQNYRQAFGRGIKSRYYALSAQGSDVLSLDSIQFNVATLARKV